MVSGKSLQSNKIYTVAFSDYLLKGFDISFLSAKNKDIVSVYIPVSIEISFDIRKSIIDYLKN